MSGDRITALFKAVLERAPTEREQIRLLKLGKALSISDDDPLWSVLIALEHYERLYDAIPDRIADAWRRVSETATGDARAFFEREKIAIEATLAHAVEANLVGQMRLKLREWTMYSAIAILITVSISIGVGMAIGNSVATNREHREHAWIDQFPGTGARSLAATGVVNLIKNCQSVGILTIDRDGMAICRRATLRGPVIGQVRIPQI